MEQRIKRRFIISTLAYCDEHLRKHLESMTDENISVLHSLLGNIYNQHDYFVTVYEHDFCNIENHTAKLLDSLVEFAKNMR